jgi:hypothetical protein
VSATGWEPIVLITDDNLNDTGWSGEATIATDTFRNAHVVWADLSGLDNSGPHDRIVGTQRPPLQGR